MSEFTHISKDYICASSDSDELFRIRSYISNKASQFGFSESDSQKIALAVDEACSNLIRYAFQKDHTKQFCVEVDINDSDRFIVYVLDNGKPFDPLQVPRPEMDKYFKEYRKGGLGIHLMRTIMDEISYSPSDSNRNQNILKLIKVKY